MNKKSMLVLTAICLIVTVLVYFRFKHSNQTSPSTDALETSAVYSKRRNAPCPGPTHTDVMEDIYLRGILEKDQKYQWVENYFNCNPIKHGDLAVFKYHLDSPPVVRIVKGVPGDEFTVVRDSKLGWTIEVNGKPIGSEKEPYYFGVPSAPPPLALAEKSRHGKLGPREVILVSAFPPGNHDSALQGVIALDDIIGKVISDTPKGDK